MRTLVVDVSAARIVLTRFLGRISRAAYFAPTSPLRLLQLPDPPLPAANWVRVRNRLCGICGSDLHQLFLDSALDIAPLALPAHRRIFLGHEMVGEVVEAGDKVTELTEPAAVAIHAAWRHIPAPGNHVLVIGCGTIGLLLLQVLRHLQPACHLAVQAEFPWQVDLARELGAQEAFLAQEDGYRQTAALTGARLYTGRGHNRMLMGGFDAIFDVVGVPVTLTDALRWTRAGGTVVLVGVCLHRMRVDLTPVWYQEVNLVGTIGHDVVQWQGQPISTFELAMMWMRTGVIRVESLLTHCFALDDYRPALDTAVDKARHRSIKVALSM